MEIKKVSKKVDLNVSAQKCYNCKVYKNATASLYNKLGRKISGCYITYTTRWSSWW